MSTILGTIRWLSIALGAVSLFYLGQHIIDFGLSDTFLRIHEWYAGIVHPIVEVLKPVALWIADALRWTLPMWWKDALFLYLMMGGAASRSRSDITGEARQLKRSVKGADTDNPNTERLKRLVRRGTLWDLSLLPIRFVAWPLFWIANVVAWLSVRFAGASSYSFFNRLFSGYFLSSVLEFSMILLGALIFAGLNAFV